MKQNKTYDQEFKEKVIKEYHETKNLSAVAKSNSVPVTTIRQWVINRDPKRIAKKAEKRKLDHLEKENQDLRIQNEILKELLKKTNKAWPKD